MVLPSQREQVRSLISDTVTLLCKNSLTFGSNICVEGLLGITVDDDDIFLVNIHRQEEKQAQDLKDQNHGKEKLQKEILIEDIKSENIDAEDDAMEKEDTSQVLLGIMEHTSDMSVNEQESANSIECHVCQECPEDMWTHMTSVHNVGKESQICLYCGRSYRELAFLLGHVAANHSIRSDNRESKTSDNIAKNLPVESDNEDRESEMVRPDSSEKKATCKRCGKSFRDQYGVSRHLSRKRCRVENPGQVRKWTRPRQGVVGTVPCVSCGERFTTKSSLNRHMRGRCASSLSQNIKTGSSPDLQASKAVDSPGTSASKTDNMPLTVIKVPSFPSEEKDNTMQSHQLTQLIINKVMDLKESPPLKKPRKWTRPRHDVIGAYPCSLCGLRLSTSASLDRHISRRHKLDSLSAEAHIPPPVVSIQSSDASSPDTAKTLLKNDNAEGKRITRGGNL